MKTRIFFLLVFIGLDVSTWTAEYKLSEEVTLNSVGFVQLDFGNEVDFVRRIRPFTSIQRGDYGIFSDFDLARTEVFGNENGNWLERLYIFHDFNEDAQLRAGRLFLNFNTPMPSVLKTVEYWQHPFKPFAYGVQFSHKHKNLLSIISITGNTGLSFDERRQFDRLESSGRFKYNMEPVTLGFGYQVSEDFVRLGTDVLWVVNNKFNVFGGLYYRDETSRQETSAVGILEWVPIQEVRPHVQIEKQFDGGVEPTVGVGFYKQRWRLTVDYEATNKTP